MVGCFTCFTRNGLKISLREKSPGACPGYYILPGTVRGKCSLSSSYRLGRGKGSEFMSWGLVKSAREDAWVSGNCVAPAQVSYRLYATYSFGSSRRVLGARNSVKEFGFSRSESNCSCYNNLLMWNPTLTYKIELSDIRLDLEHQEQNPKVSSTPK
ncbi:hypothetical protein BHE74_00039841 [Ensete ventricosum]|nr:hypothetical protein BHE74_00039841 [Ensete ventricosum]RZS13027.1 hypothetical protein BHM03_00044549 [Ensete ventricosum]